MKRRSPKLKDLDMKKLAEILRCAKTRPLSEEECEALHEAIKKFADLRVEFLEATKDENITADMLYKRLISI